MSMYLLWGVDNCSVSFIELGSTTQCFEPSSSILYFEPNLHYLLTTSRRIGKHNPNPNPNPK